MGTQMTKELGVYNEEEKVCTPLGPHRCRILNNDPRSVTSGIIRTPIQVQCTPTGFKTIKNLNKNDLQKFENSTSNDSISDEICAENNDEACNGHQINGTSFDEEITNASSDEKNQDLENVIEANDIKSRNTDSFSAKPKPRPVLELMDVRSPTVEITRTPIVVECTPELFALHSQIENLSFCDVDLLDDEPSAIVSEDDQSCHANVSNVKKWLFGVENQNISPLMNSSLAESPRLIARKQKELNALKKQLFFSTEGKEETFNNVSDDKKIQKKPKTRTPLGDLQASQLQDSPQMLVRSKQWRNIQEERKRRGIIDTENTPPSLPPLSQISSAPGKIFDRKRSKVNWDEENTMLI